MAGDSGRPKGSDEKRLTLLRETPLCKVQTGCILRSRTLAQAKTPPCVDEKDFKIAM